MKIYVDKIIRVVKKSRNSIMNDGVASFLKRGTLFAFYRMFPDQRKKKFKDILFINGCALPHPTRYRVYHQIEQLKAAGMSADAVFYENLTMDQLKYYRGFIFFRCPVTDTVRGFIMAAKQYNKTCFYDIDDLVIDQKYTNKIKYIKEMTHDGRKLYNDGVNRMRETLELCDHAITTTQQLQTELKHYCKGEVYVNRNTASDEMVMHSLRAYKNAIREKDKVVIGYFSGSVTHNEDFELVMPSLIRLMEKYDNVHLKIAGILDIPTELAPYAGRIEISGFVDWREMPKSIAVCDINLAPLADNIFNEAKSENKWIEAALVRVVTIASDIGAFKKVIKDGETGVLVKNDWYAQLEDLVLNRSKREALAYAAHEDVLVNHTTIYTCHNFTKFVRDKLARNIAFFLPTTDISGGVNVILKHADILRRNGWDVSVIDAIDKKSLKKSKKAYGYRLDLPGYNVILKHKTKIEAYFETMVASLWTTVKDVKEYPNTTHRLYFVQSFETDFSAWGIGAPRILANATYGDATGIEYITMSLWCKKWLKERFDVDATYAPNGIDLYYYKFRKRDLKKDSKTSILIEGDSKSESKNTDESFKIVEKLDGRRYEVSYLSYRKEPKNWYKVDHFYNRITPEKVGEVYANCDILIKSSLLESFSYPPLEMMATGGLSVVIPNDGNIEYLKDGENCLFYKRGDIDDCVSKIERLVNDKQLRDKLIRGGYETAKKYQWEHIEKDIVSLYG